MKKPTLQQRLSAKNRSKAMLVGITWYTAETWAQVKATASDPERFEESFAEWEAVAVKARRDFQRSGVTALEFQVVPQDFFAWCALHGKENNAEARAEFVSGSLSAVYESGKA